MDINLKRMRRVQRVHFVGIGGSGMSGIAEILHSQRYQVTGSDVSNTPTVQSLRTAGINISIGHSDSNIAGVDVVVRSSAIADDNAEIIAARRQRIPIVPRAQMLAEIMRSYHGIAISGTHGKTTTTSMVAHILCHAGLEPTYVIGGRLNNTQSNASLGAGNVMVVEADESDASFLHLNPIISAITNIEAEHMNNYGGDFGKVQQTYVQFIHNLPFYGLVVACYDDSVVRSLFEQFNRALVSYGFNPKADLYADDISYQGINTSFSACWRASGKKLAVEMQVPGAHNILNALAAIAIAKDINISDDHIAGALQSFTGVGRRLEDLGTHANDSGSITGVRFYDDYGHHPTEIAATLSALRNAYPESRIVMIFQPHRYTRLRDLYEEFTKVLSSSVDALLLLPLYTAGEEAIADINSKALARSIRQLGRIDPIVVDGLKELQQILPNLLNSNDIFLTQGAGNVGALAQGLHAANLFLKNSAVPND